MRLYPRFEKPEQAAFVTANDTSMDILSSFLILIEFFEFFFMCLGYKCGYNPLVSNGDVGHRVMAEGA